MLRRRKMTSEPPQKSWVAINTWRYPQEREGNGHGDTKSIEQKEDNATYRYLSQTTKRNLINERTNKTEKEDDRSSEIPPKNFPQAF